MILRIRSYYDQAVSTALLAFSLRLSAFCLKFQSVLRSPPIGIGVLDINHSYLKTALYRKHPLLFFAFIVHSPVCVDADGVGQYQNLQSDHRYISFATCRPNYWYF